MPMYKTGISNNGSVKMQRQSGFTLVEIIVVMVIVGILVTVVTLSFGNSQARQGRDYLRQISALIDLATEQAVFNSRDYGLSFSKQGYRFFELEDGIWRNLSNDRMFKTRDIPQGFQHVLYLEGIKVVLAQDDKKKPQIYITSDGEVSQFQLDVFDQSNYIYRLQADEQGIFQVAQVNS